MCQFLVFKHHQNEGRPWPNRYSSCTTNVYKLDPYTGAPGFDPELRQYSSRVPSPCGLTVVSNIFPPLNLASRDIACTKKNHQYVTLHQNQDKFNKNHYCRNVFVPILNKHTSILMFLINCIQKVFCNIIRNQI